jgi:hypothetical protein
MPLKVLCLYCQDYSPQRWRTWLPSLTTSMSFSMSNIRRSIMLQRTTFPSLWMPALCVKTTIHQNVSPKGHLHWMHPTPHQQGWLLFLPNSGSPSLSNNCHCQLDNTIHITNYLDYIIYYQKVSLTHIPTNSCISTPNPKPMCVHDYKGGATTTTLSLRQ